MGFFRKKKPAKKPEQPAAPTPAKSEPATAGGGAEANGKPTPKPPQHPAEHYPYIEEFNRISQIERVKSIEYTDTRTWRMNFGDDYDHESGPVVHYESNFQCHPFHGGYGGNYMHDHMLPGPPHHLPLPGQSRPLALPPPDYYHGPPRMLPSSYCPYDGGMFSDENPNGCMIM